MSARSPFCLKLHVLQVGGWIKRKRDLIFFLLRMFHFSFRGTEDAKFCVSLSGKQQGLEKKQKFLLPYNVDHGVTSQIYLLSGS